MKTQEISTSKTVWIIISKTIWSYSKLQMEILQPWINLYKFYKKKSYPADENHRAFRAWTGTHPFVAEKIFRKYKNYSFLPNRSRILIVLNYLKTMPTEEGSSQFGISRKTYRKYVWQSLFYLEYIMTEINTDNRYTIIIIIITIT